MSPAIRTLLIGLGASTLIALFPFVIVLASWASAGFQGKMLSEGPGGHGTALWLMMVTLPIGGIGALVSIVASILVALVPR